MFCHFLFNLLVLSFLYGIFCHAEDWRMLKRQLTCGVRTCSGNKTLGRNTTREIQEPVKTFLYPQYWWYSKVSEDNSYKYWRIHAYIPPSKVVIFTTVFLDRYNISPMWRRTKKNEIWLKECWVIRVTFKKSYLLSFIHTLILMLFTKLSLSQSHYFQLK